VASAKDRGKIGAGGKRQEPIFHFSFSICKYDEKKFSEGLGFVI
jgi:hypothetical protein